jgi:signal transduction histidine kinase
LKDDTGRVTGLVVEGHDDTERKRAERELAEAHEFLSSSLDALSSHIAVLDESGVVLAVNDAWRRFADENFFTGHNYGVGANYIESCEPSDDECLDESMVSGLKDVLAGRVPLFEYEYPCHSPTEQRWFVLRATRFKSPGPVRVVVAHENVTKRKLAEDSLKDADRRKDEFLATLAHELRNPLAPIRNGLQVLRLAGGGGEMVEEARSMMERQLTHMVRLVDDLLDVSRITRNKLELRKERVALATVIHTAVETSRPMIEQAGHTFSVTLTPTPVYLDADPVRLAQVFSNLLNNAAKYTEPGGRITLTAERHGTAAVVRVKDNGLGIPAEAQLRVFEMFSQVDRNMERAQGGLGIGLTLVRRLTEMHGGTVHVTSDGPGKGSEFTVSIPVSKDVPEKVAAHSTGLDGVAGSPRRILVVDDNRDSAESLGMMLRLMGNDVRTAHDGLAAVEVADAYRPEMILLDIGLPKLNGYDACRRIREQPWSNATVIVALTGWGQEGDRRRSQEAGFNHHLVKPVDLDNLTRLLAQVKR